MMVQAQVSRLNFSKKNISFDISTSCRSKYLRWCAAVWFFELFYIVYLTGISSFAVVEWCIFHVFRLFSRVWFCRNFSRVETIFHGCIFAVFFTGINYFSRVVSEIFSRGRNLLPLKYLKTCPYTQTYAKNYVHG